MRVLGIDPGYGRCGVAVIEERNHTQRLVHSECIETTPATLFPDRLAYIVSECNRIADLFTPDVFAIEKLYFSTNQKTAMHVAEVRGALLSLASSRHTEIFEYTPSQVKNAAAGWGGADKKQVVKMLHLLLKIDKEIKHDDEYDAIAVSITHLAHKGR